MLHSLEIKKYTERIKFKDLIYFTQVFARKQGTFLQETILCRNNRTKIVSYKWRFINCTFFKCYLAAPRANSGHYKRVSLTNPILITAFWYSLDPKVTGCLVTRLGSKAQPSTLWALTRNPSNSKCNALNHPCSVLLNKHLLGDSIVQKQPDYS